VALRHCRPLCTARRRRDRLACRLRAGRHALFVGARLRLLTLADAGLPLRGAALALGVVEQRTLVVELLQGRAPIFAYAGDTARHREALRALALAGTCTRFDFCPLTFDACALGAFVIGSGRSAEADQHGQQRALK
jgi:hypothetical protein